jgi:hypothetical protein
VTLTIGIDHSAPELTELEPRIAEAEAAERRAGAVSAAQQNLLSGLQEQRQALFAQLPALRAELALAQFDRATLEIETLKAEEREAAEVYGAVHARLCGAGRAHNEMAAELRQKYGASVQPLGTQYPDRVLSFHPVGFGFDDRGGFNTLSVDIGTATDDATAEFLARWRAAR